ncbi:hypothetical protein ABE29_08680 [Cytobacillus firmus]|uniref:aldehyde dehydrogenase family protein n=1 Tax=Cytobacillus firmus TaxID=1399 RepID=UPI00077C7731|nr:aldehyde dehydrogenase family protein [Cytobacillus firmus]MBG9542855.1 hypothetical protein [Cytobacillus firmus]MBG9550371.1 hypothetical protein [Cytobacillus firmus]MBG9554262.1 hypothetical protein [Cytobacillus firmus]MBG9557071.1 hypothetical protein [Cytobacillus firmus]MBG9576577.1 hypothetical protein [Cytobacillus firmus]
MSTEVNSQKTAFWNTGAETYYNYIGGEWVPSVTGETYPSLNPAHIDEVLGYFQKSNEVDVQKAIESAKRAFPEWKNTSPISRGDILFKLIFLIQQEKEEWEGDGARKGQA